jgi:gas vesicle protein
MKTGFTGRISRIAASLAVVGAIAGAAAGGFAADTSGADAALKWREEVVKWTAKAAKCKDKDITCTTTTDTSTTP